MERELEKTLIEIESAIKNNEQRGNTHTQSVLQIAHEIIELCAKAARTLPDLQEILEREYGESADYEGDGYDDDGNVIYDTWICPNCGQQLKREVD